MNVADIMTTDVVTVTPETSLRDVAVILVERRISGVPVVDGERLVGVVSEADFLAKEAGELRHVAPAALRRLLGESRADEQRTARVQATKAGEAMTSPAHTIGPDSSLAEAARQMDERKINRLPVVDDGRLVGIVTRADIVRSFVRGDTAVDADLRRALRAVDGLYIESVRDGVVVLTGTVRHRALVETVAHLAAAVPGVVAVNTQGIRWFEPTDAGS